MSEQINLSDKFLCSVHTFNSDNFVHQVLPHTVSENSRVGSVFDDLFWKRFSEAEAEGALNYPLDNLKTTVLEGKYGIVAQFIPERAATRRKPSPFHKISEPFDPNGFNFTKIDEKEILFNIKVNLFPNISVSGSLIVNTAPICPTHSLLLSSPIGGLPQLVDEDGLRLAVSLVLLSKKRSLRVGLNSLCAHASVNHYHYHAYYLDYPLFVETAECREVAGSCFTFKDHFAPGFVFQVTSDNFIQSISDIMKLVKFFISSDIAHNVFMTRGAHVDGATSAQTYDVVRVFIWARRKTTEKDEWANINETSVIDKVFEECSSVFEIVLPEVKNLFSS